MPEAKVGGYYRNGKFVRGYTRRTKGGVVPDPRPAAKAVIEEGRRAVEARGKAAVSAGKTAVAGGKRAVGDAAKAVERKAESTKAGASGTARAAAAAANPFRATTSGIKAKGSAMRTADMPSRKIAAPKFKTAEEGFAFDRALAGLDRATSSGKALTARENNDLSVAVRALSVGATTPTTITQNMRTVGQLKAAASAAGASKKVMDQIAATERILKRKNADSSRATAGQRDKMTEARARADAQRSANKRVAKSQAAKKATAATNRAAKDAVRRPGKPSVATAAKRRVNQAVDFVEGLFD